MYYPIKYPLHAGNEWSITRARPRSDNTQGLMLELENVWSNIYYSGKYPDIERSISWQSIKYVSTAEL